MDDTSEGESDLGSPSLPSLPTSLQQQMNQIEEQRNQPQQQKQQTQQYTSTMTVKEADKRIAELRRENFNLKLRLYFVEKDKNGVSKPEYESAVAGELAKREKAIRAYQKVVNEKDNQLEALKNLFDEQMRKKDDEIEQMKIENNNLLSDIQVNNSVCRSLMSHLNEIKNYWRNILNNSTASKFQMNDFVNSFGNWVNTSEDILNTASVLITDNCLNNNPEETFNNTNDVTDLGMSSLGIFSNLSEIIETKGNYRKSPSKYKVSTREEEVQTELSLLELDAIICDYESLVNKEYRNQVTQTNILKQSEQQTQTPFIKNVTKDQSTETEKINKEEMVSIGIQIKPSNVDVLLQTNNFNCLTDGETQTSFIEHESSKNETKINKSSNDVNGNNSNETQTIITNTNKEFIDNSSDKFSAISTKNYSSYSHIHRSRDSLTTVQEQTDNVDSVGVKSFPSSPVKRSSIDAKEHLSNSSSHLFKMPNNDYLVSQIKRATITKVINSSFANNLKINNDTLSDNMVTSNSLQSSRYTMPKKSFSSSSCSSTNSSYDESSHTKPLVKSIATRQQSTNVKINKATPTFKSSLQEELMMSSPDLGLGDSDNDHQHGILRAYLTINKYQSLRCYINELFSIIHSVENLSRDYTLKLVNINEYFSEMKLFTSNIYEIINHIRTICRNFNVEDTQTLQLQLEKIRNRKENMEKVITRQLMKTDKLLKKAKINLKDN